MFLDRRLEKKIALLPGVRAEVVGEAQRMAVEARAALAPHRETGQARIQVRRRGPDAVVSLVDPWAIAIEFGHDEYVRSDGHRVGASEGIHVMRGLVERRAR